MIHDFDPYTFIMKLSSRLDRLEHAHNSMAHAFHQSEQELNETLKLLRSLQINHKHLQNLLIDICHRNNISIPEAYHEINTTRTRR